MDDHLEFSQKRVAFLLRALLSVSRLTFIRICLSAKKENEKQILFFSSWQSKSNRYLYPNVPTFLIKTILYLKEIQNFKLYENQIKIRISCKF